MGTSQSGARGAFWVSVENKRIEVSVTSEEFGPACVGQSQGGEEGEEKDVRIPRLIPKSWGASG